ncbi:MAG: hypothetical protein NTX50_06970 [Candidatus Sumerlaeota bacterium]|nr:hypothetical protein [Candidatus Sumerlaeota bacterium]
MPIRDALLRTDVPEEAALLAELKAELENPKESGEPDIIIERPSPFTTHLFVIWSKWKDLEQSIRSRIVMDAFEEVRGEEEMQKVTAAMGLTAEEADRLGIK